MDSNDNINLQEDQFETFISHTNIPQKIAFSESTVGGKILRARIF